MDEQEPVRALRGKKRAAQDPGIGARPKLHVRQPQNTISPAEVVAYQQQAQMYDIANAQAEVAAAMMSAQDRKDAQAESTKKQYARFQAHWMVSCSSPT